MNIGTRPWLLLIVLLAGAWGPLFGQGSHAAGTEITVHVKGLTSAERDALKQELTGRNDVELVYACVPAGILVFRGADHGTLRSTVLPLVSGRTSSARSRELQLGRAEVEERCAAQRGQ